MSLITVDYGTVTGGVQLKYVEYTVTVAVGMQDVTIPNVSKIYSVCANSSSYIGYAGLDPSTDTYDFYNTTSNQFHLDAISGNVITLGSGGSRSTTFRVLCE